MPCFFVKPFHKKVAKHDAGPQQANLRIAQTQPQNFGSFRILQTVEISECNDFAVVFRQSRNAFAE